MASIYWHEKSFHLFVRGNINIDLRLALQLFSISVYPLIIAGHNFEKFKENRKIIFTVLFLLLLSRK